MRAVASHHSLVRACSKRQFAADIPMGTRAYSLRARQRLTSACAATRGQELRGHGDTEWKDAGWNLKTMKLEPELGQLLTQYGELAQATYDNLGVDPCSKTWGYVRGPQANILDYLTSNYALRPGAPTPKGHVGTNSRYKLPSDPTGQLSPIIYALPGHNSDCEIDNRSKSLAAKFFNLQLVIDALYSKVFADIAAVVVAYVDDQCNSGPLFHPDPKTGRGQEERGAFMGYIAVSESNPGGDDNEMDVAVVWRGTIFKEEWESNVAQDNLKPWIDQPDEPTSIRVHDGFFGLYKCETQQLPSEVKASPRTVVHEWLELLMKEHNVTTITTTGHSLGGALATLSAFDVGEWLGKKWDSFDKKGWKTQSPPKVTVMSFASPRVGNFVFMSQFKTYGVQSLRLVNKDDPVPRIPGVWVEFLSGIVQRIPFIGRAVAFDSANKLSYAAAYLYYAACVFFWPWHKSRYGYCHVGQVLQLDKVLAGKDESGKDILKPKLGFTEPHNLELYLFLLSKKYGNDSRNPLLINKSADLLYDMDANPANWWNASDPKYPHRGCRLEPDGRWHKPAPKADEYEVANQKAEQIVY